MNSRASKNVIYNNGKPTARMPKVDKEISPKKEKKLKNVKNNKPKKS